MGEQIEHGAAGLAHLLVCITYEYSYCAVKISHPYE